VHRFSSFSSILDILFQLDQYVHLYDARNYTGGAFAELKVMHSDIEAVLGADFKQLAGSLWSSMKFNATGTQILVGSSDGLSLTLDGFEGTVQKAFCDKNATGASCWSSDDKTILTGNQDGSISCWNVESGELVKKLEGHSGPVGCIASNPKYTMLASACTNTALWLWPS
jgi:COMPASS component SWD2